MSEQDRLDGKKLGKYLAEVEKSYSIHNDDELIAVLNKIIMEESDQEIIEEAIDCFFV